MTEKGKSWSLTNKGDMMIDISRSDSDSKEGDEQDHGSAKRDEGDEGDGSASFRLEKQMLKKKIEHDMVGSDTDKIYGLGKGFNDRARFLNNEALRKKFKRDVFEFDSEDKSQREVSDKAAKKMKLLDTSYKDSTAPLPETKSSQTKGLPDAKNTLVYCKVLSEDDICSGKLSIPLEIGQKILPEPTRDYGGITRKTTTIAFKDHNGRIWSTEVLFHHQRRCYMLGSNWEAYVKLFNLEDGESIFLKQEPSTNSAVKLRVIPLRYSTEKTILFEKKINQQDISTGWLSIPLEDGIKFISEPSKLAEKYQGTELLVFEGESRTWFMHAAYEEGTKSYHITSNWDTFVKKYHLKPQDKIVISHDPSLRSYEKYYIECETSIKHDSGGQS